MKSTASLLVAATLLLGGGCATAPRPFAPRASSAEDARLFPGATEKKMLTASAAVLQDLGFSLDGGDSKLGLILASKERSAQAKPSAASVAADAAGIAAVVAGSVILAGPLGPLALLQLAGGGNDDVPDRQVIRVSLLAARSDPARDGDVVVRLAAQRVVYSKQNRVLLSESLADPALVEAFFAALEKSVFLQAHHL